MLPAPTTAHSADYVASGPLLYVTNQNPVYNDVTVYHAGAKDPAPIAMISDDLNGPAGVCLDSQGTLYVTNQPNDGLGWVTEYPLGKTNPSKTITRGMNTPAYCAIDRSGNLWVTNIGGRNATEYLHGSKKPHTVITEDMVYPTGIAIDSSGNLYVSNRLSSGGDVVVFPPGSEDPSRTITDGVTSPVALAIDASGNLYVTNVTQNNIEEYAPGADQPFRTITQGVSTPAGLTVSERAGSLPLTSNGIPSLSFDRGQRDFQNGALAMACTRQSDWRSIQRCFRSRSIPAAAPARPHRVSEVSRLDQRASLALQLRVPRSAAARPRSSLAVLDRGA